jgi:hypothetical protein
MRKTPNVLTKWGDVPPMLRYCLLEAELLHKSFERRVQLPLPRRFSLSY